MTLLDSNFIMSVAVETATEDMDGHQNQSVGIHALEIQPPSVGEPTETLSTESEVRTVLVS